jgi:hypothetical protein
LLLRFSYPNGCVKQQLHVMGLSKESTLDYGVSAARFKHDQEFMIDGEPVVAVGKGRSPGDPLQDHMLAQSSKILSVSMCNMLCVYDMYIAIGSMLSTAKDITS